MGHCQGLKQYQVIWDETLEELRLPQKVLEEAQQAWTVFTVASSKEAAGGLLLGPRGEAHVA